MGLHFIYNYNERHSKYWFVSFLHTTDLSHLNFTIPRLNCLKTLTTLHGGRSRGSEPPLNSDRCSQFEKHIIVSVRSKLPQKCSTVLSEPKFGPPNNKSLICPCFPALLSCNIHIQILLWPFRPLFGLKIEGGLGCLGPLPWIRHWYWYLYS